MVDQDIAARGVRSPRVLEAMRRVPRERFVPPGREDLAYEDAPLPIGEGQTISQPYIVAYMVEALALHGGERVLEIGTGSGPRFSKGAAGVWPGSGVRTGSVVPRR